MVISSFCSMTGFPTYSFAPTPRHRCKVDLKIDRVVSDCRDATLEIMAHLLALGQRGIGFVYGIAAPTLGEDRLSADQEFVNELELIGQQVAFGESTVDEAAASLQALIERLAVK